MRHKHTKVLMLAMTIFSIAIPAWAANESTNQTAPTVTAVPSESTIQSLSLPDLKVEIAQIGVFCNYDDGRRTATITIGIRNVGVVQADMSKLWDKVKIEADMLSASNDGLFVPSMTVGIVKPNELIKGVVQIKGYFPQIIKKFTEQEELHKFRIVVDPNNEIAESNESNNTAWAIAYVKTKGCQKITAPLVTQGLPDLIVASTQITKVSCKPNGKRRSEGVVKIANIGKDVAKTKNINNLVVIRANISDTQNQSSFIAPLISIPNDIKPGETVALNVVMDNYESFASSWPDSEDHRFIVKVDNADQIHEFDENNNESFMGARIKTSTCSIAINNVFHSLPEESTSSNGTLPDYISPEKAKTRQGMPSSENVRFGSKVQEIKQGTEGGNTRNLPKASGAVSPKSDIPLPNTSTTQNAKASDSVGPMTVGDVKLVLPDLAVEHLTAQLSPGCSAKHAIRIDLSVRNAGTKASPALTGNHALYVDALDDAIVDKRVNLPALQPKQNSTQQVILASKVQPAELAGKTIYMDVMVNKEKRLGEADYANNVRKVRVAFPQDHCKMTMLPIQQVPSPQERGLAAPADNSSRKTDPGSRDAPATNLTR